jgi:hypothetical protein
MQRHFSNRGEALAEVTAARVLASRKGPGKSALVPSASRRMTSKQWFAKSMEEIRQPRKTRPRRNGEGATVLSTYPDGGPARGSTVRKGCTSGRVGQADLKNTKSMPLRQSARSGKDGLGIGMRENSTRWLLLMPKTVCTFRRTMRPFTVAIPFR